MLASLTSLYEGRVTVTEPQDGAPEWHVNRALNVAASAAAHGRYFRDADGIFMELFNREPIAQQPDFIADMGCGDGSWLIHLYGLVRDRTLRGRHLDDHPLRMVGIDFNEAALEPARRALAAADVPGLLISGDVGDPAGLRSALSREGLDIENGLHIRSFLDHDRTYWGGDPQLDAPGFSSGAYVDAHGLSIDGADVERDLVLHFERWSPHLRKHGLVTLEAHCVHPRVARRHLGSLHSVAFDAYHAYSHQYPVEYAAFLWCARRAGLERLGYCERHYPTTRPFVAVSLNRFVTPPNEQELPAWDPRAPREDTWRPKSDVDLEDGERLHELLFEAGDLRRPRLWCSAATGFVVGGTLDVIEERLELATEGDAIRVLDYGTGTGLAAIELLKAVAERGLERRLEERGVSLELHLADLPGPWLAQGYRLLQGCSWTRFHALRDGDGAFARCWRSRAVSAWMW